MSDIRTTIMERCESMMSKIKKDEEKIPQLIKELENAVTNHDKRILKNKISELKHAETDFLLRYGKFLRDETIEQVEHSRIDTYFSDNKVCSVSESSAKGKLYDKFISEIEHNSIKAEQISSRCSCDGYLIFDEIESQEICSNCGFVGMVIQNTPGSYKEEQDIEYTSVFTYKRSNHFAEHLTQLQAKENTTIPIDVIENIRSELKKERVSDLKTITNAKIRRILKKLKMNKYYEHIPHITNVINGIPAPQINRQLEIRLKHMFEEIQAPFEKHCPSSRKNFMSYSYVLYKMCELLEEDHLLPCFPLLKSTEKLYEQDKIWEKICKELRWEYIKTI